VNPDGAPAVGADIHVKAVAVDATGHLYLANGFQVMAEGNPRIFSWGFNGLGQLGDGTTVDRPAPVRSLAYGEDVFAGGYHSFTSTEAWGYNNFGQLGTGSSAAFAPTPTLIVKPEVRFDTVAGGLFHNVALATDGSVYSWGWNGYGALGDGTTTARTVPTVIGGVSGAGAVAVGAVHSVIVR
jgi:alpha-tubulin suppressor-like RCC1 family protein